MTILFHTRCQRRGVPEVRHYAGRSSGFGESHQNKWSKTFQRPSRIRRFTITGPHSFIRTSRARQML
jgi:hypothetical protein